MQRLIGISFFVYSYVTITYAQILYECNFDTGTIANSCLFPTGGNAMLVDSNMGSATNQPPTGPLSDVTSSLKPTTNGLPCSLPYRADSYTWDMYFCNNGFCPTPGDPNTRCTTGRFGHYNFFAPQTVSFTLNTDSGGTNGTNQQCLTYYYYLPNITGTQQNIKIRIQEPGGNSDQIDYVTNSPFNGWIQRQVSFSTVKPGYKIYFDLQKTSGIASPASTICIDEILVRQGSCSDEPVTQSTTTTTMATSTVMTSDNILETSTIQTTIATTMESTTTITTMEPTTARTTTTATGTPATATLVVATTISSTSIATPTPTTSITTITVESTMSPNTTTIISITTSTSTTSRPATGTPSATATLSTSDSLDNHKDDDSSNKTLIIALSTAIPLSLIAIVGIGVWIKRSAASGILSSIRRPFTDVADQDQEGTLELNEYEEGHTF